MRGTTRNHNGDYSLSSQKRANQTMIIHYDKNVDAAYLKLSDDQPTGVIEIAEGINVDVTEEGGIVGIEILDVKKKFPLKSLFICEYDPGLLFVEGA
jgi:uncharacterized protein YuzE